MNTVDYDAVVVGSGPNGLSAAITLQQAGLSVLLIEAKSVIGGGLRTEELTLPGFKHDICSAIHPMAAGSSFFSSLPLDKFGLEYIQFPIAAAHPLDNGTAAILHKSIEETALSLLGDGNIYRKLMEPIVKNWNDISADILGPLRIPSHPVETMQFGLRAIPSALHGARRFSTIQARGLWAGMAAHSIQPLSNIATSAFSLVLMASAHLYGWPTIRSGSQAMATALGNYFTSLGGKIQTGFLVESLKQLPRSHIVMFDITPKQLLKIAGHKLSTLYTAQLKRYRYGAGVFKIDWALDSPAPFNASAARVAGTVHLGNTIEEIAAYEKMIWQNKHGDKPFVLYVQQTIADSSRAPAGKHTAWAYCHVPHGSNKDMTNEIENQVERFAPGFKDRILRRHTFNTEQLEEYNPNYIGGDINGGVIDIKQLFTRPVLRFSPYSTSAKGLYICSSSTPPGGGVHGLCGYHAAQRALKDLRADLKKYR